MAKPGPRRWKRKPHFYWWTLANVLAACTAVIVWVLCLHVFGHPEIPKNYHWLEKLDLAAPAVGYKLQEAPAGQAADPRALYRRYAELDWQATVRLNRSLLRNYLTGLKQPGLIQYIEGDFEITHVRELDDGDLFHPGVVVRGRAMIKPTEFSEAAPWPVTVDYLFPTPDPRAADWFRRGDRLEVAKAPNCALLLHVARDSFDDSPMVQLTVVPIALGEYRLGPKRNFDIVRPDDLNPAARFPLFREDDFSVPSVEDREAGNS